mgnify:CR=1 FL=1
MIDHVPIYHQHCRTCAHYRRLTGREGMCKHPQKVLKGFIRGALSGDWCPSWKDGREGEVTA